MSFADLATSACYSYLAHSHYVIPCVSALYSYHARDGRHHIVRWGMPHYAHVCWVWVFAFPCECVCVCVRVFGREFTTCQSHFRADLIAYLYIYYLSIAFVKRRDTLFPFLIFNSPHRFAPTHQSFAQFPVSTTSMSHSCDAMICLSGKRYNKWNREM